MAVVAVPNVINDEFLIKFRRFMFLIRNVEM
jgi:hypothetical protein